LYCGAFVDDCYATGENILFGSFAPQRVARMFIRGSFEEKDSVNAEKRRIPVFACRTAQVFWSAPFYGAIAWEYAASFTGD
jgi:hypothetical protein